MPSVIRGAKYMMYLDESAVKRVLQMQDLIPLMKKVMIEFSQGRITQPTRRIIEVQPYGGFFGSMPAAGKNVVGAKLVTFYPGNAAKGIHTHMAMIILFHPETGQPMVTMEGRLITEMRTSATSAAFIDATAAEDVKTLAILGAGTQGKSHIAALSHVRRFKEIRIWNRTPKRAEELAREVGGTVMSRQEAVHGADVVVVATASTEPVLEGKWLKPGAKVVSAGWAGSDGTEVDADVMSNVVVVDSHAGTQAESGNIRRHSPTVFAQLGEVLDGSRPVKQDATVIFDSIGMACQDLAAAKLVYDKYTA